jgi:hypothetical protein
MDKMLERLRTGGLTLLVEKGGRLVHASDRAGLRPLFDGVIEHPEIFEGADVAPSVVGLAAAYLLVNVRAARVITPSITREAEKALTEAGIVHHGEQRLKALEDPDGHEQLARESVTPARFLEALRTKFE